jgi:hypothetical protein
MPGIDLALWRDMNPKSFPAILAAAVVAGTFLMPMPSGGQTGEEIVTSQLLTEVTAQQATLIDNQTKIDAKLATIGENIRQARIYAGRGK